MAHVTVPNQNARIAYTAEDGQTAFPVPFPFFTDIDLLVLKNGGLTTTGYAVTGVPADGGFQSGYVIFTAPPGAGVQVVIRRRVIAQRATDFPYPSRILDLQALNTDLDRLAAALMDLQAEVQQSVRGRAEEGDMTPLPARLDRVFKLAGFDGNGDLTVFDPAASGGGGGGIFPPPPGSVNLDKLSADLAARIALIDGSGAGSVNLRIASEAASRTGADVAIAQIVSNVASSQTALASIVSTVQTQAAGALASVQQVLASDAARSATYLLQLDVNGYVIGLGAYNDGTPVGSGFVLRTDRFRIAPPGAAGGVSPFEVIGDDVYIRNAIIGTARIGTSNLAAKSAGDMVGVFDNTSYYGTDASQLVQVFGFTMENGGNAAVTLSMQLDTGLQADDWRVEMFLDGVSMGAREGYGKFPLSFASFQQPSAGFHEIQVRYYGHPTCMLKGLSLIVDKQWR